MQELDRLFFDFLRRKKEEGGLLLPEESYKREYLEFKKRFEKGTNKGVARQYSRLKLLIKYLESFFEKIEKEVRQKQCNLSIRQEFDNPDILKLYDECKKAVGKIKSHDNSNRSVIKEQLSRRYESIITQSDGVFFRGIATFVRYIIKNNFLSGVINSGDFSSNDKNTYESSMSRKASWIRLEIVFLFTYCKTDLYKKLGKEFNKPLYELTSELNSIFDDIQTQENFFFKREKYNFDLIRIHHFLLDKLDNESIQHTSLPNNSIYYQYNNYLIPTGVLKIWEFELVEFRKLPATVLQFFYLNRSNGK